MSGGLCTSVQKVSHTSRYYPKGLPKSSVSPVVPRTSSSTVCGAYFWWSPHVHPHYRQKHMSSRPSVRPPSVGQCLASIPRGSKCGLVKAKGFGSR
jgi:hypothetical protein